MTRIVLVRHGETDWNRQRRIQGRTDIPLNETGREQARRTASALAGDAWAGVYTSPLSRASETAGIIAERLGLAAPTAVDDLIERQYGAAEGLTAAELDARIAETDEVDGRESRPDAAARALPALITLAQRHEGGRVLVVSHGGLIRSLLMHLEPHGGGHHTEPIANGSAHSLDYVDGQLVLVTFNEELRVPDDAGDDITEQNAIEQRESVPSDQAGPSAPAVP